MTKKWGSISRILLTGIFLFTCLTPSIYGQFLDLRLNVNSRLTAETIRPLTFGTVVTNSGQVQINLGDIEMGIFSVTALEDQILLARLNTPDELSHENPEVTETIPLELESRYGYSMVNYQNSYPMESNSNSIPVPANSGSSPWTTFYIYVYGAVNIGDVPDGTYSDEILLEVEYL